MSVESDGGIDMDEEQQDGKQEEVQYESVKKKKEVEKIERSTKSKEKPYLIFLSIFLVCWCINTIDKRFTQLQEGMDTAYRTLGYISKQDIVNEVNSSLERNPSVLASTDWNIKILDQETKKVELTMFVVPKEYIQGMEVTFQVDSSDGTKYSVQGEEREAMHFVGMVEVPFSELVNIYVTLQKGDMMQTTQILSDTIERNFVLDVFPHWMGKYSYYNGAFKVDGQIQVDMELDSRYEQNLRAFKKLDVVLYVADKEWKRLPVEIGQDEISYNGVSFSPELVEREQFSGILYSVNVQEMIPLEVGDSFKMTIEGEDSYGIHYRNVVIQSECKENGESVGDWGFIEETEVY